MPRPRKLRRIQGNPGAFYYKPQGIPLAILEEISLSLEEFEALRLKDYEHFDQPTAAEKMNISQPTFHRIYQSAREKIAQALVEGKALKIEGREGEQKIPYPKGRMRRGWKNAL